jgi:glycosyltransferase involved in cell wall biosynthesis
LVANWDWVLYNFRLPLARELRKAGYDVRLVSPHGAYTERLRAEQFDIIEWRLRRRSTDPLREAFAIARLRTIYARFRPDLVHHFTIKPNFYGSVAAAGLGNRQPRVVNTFTGLGFLFSAHRRASVLRLCILPFMRAALGRRANWTVFQTRPDADFFLRHRLVREGRVRVIQGSGVDTNSFRPSTRGPNRTPIIITGARLLWDKGIGDIVDAARILRGRNCDAQFWIAGEADHGNMAAIPQRVLEQWQAEGIVRLLGHQERMNELLQCADVALLPSYHEGVPRFLLEAAACGLPLVASDISGCRLVVRPGVNGHLVPVSAPSAIADAIQDLLANPGLRLAWGEASRQCAEAEFSEQQVIRQYMDLYQEVLNYEQESL